MLKKIISLLIVGALALSLASCQNNEQQNEGSAQDSLSLSNSDNEAEEFKLESSMELVYAELFSVDYYTGGYKMIMLEGEQKFLTIPEGANIPTEIDDDVIILQMPITSALIGSTSTMSLIDAIGKVSEVSQTTYDLDSWYIDSVSEALNSGEMSYIGSYKEPDYELITKEQPQLSVFNTMMNSTPEVAEKLNELSVPLLIDYASSESHPLARIEWIKLYGALFDEEEKALEHFNAQVEYVNQIPKLTQTPEENTAVIFYINSAGEIVVRNAGDYIASMYTMVGGSYALSDIGVGETGTSKLTMEEFYAKAKDSKYIIYIWSHGGEPENIAQLVEKNNLLADFEAVKNGNVWCTTPDFFQISSTIGYMMSDLNSAINMQEGESNDLTYLFKLKE